MDINLSRLSKRLDRLGQIAEFVSRKRFELEHEQQTLESCQGFLIQSAEVLLAIFRLDEVSRHPRFEQQRLSDAYLQFEVDVAAYKSRATIIRSIQQDLTDLESRMKKRADKVFETPAEVSHPPPQSPPGLPDIDLETNTSSTVSSLPSFTPPLIAAYLDQKGDIGVFKERLLELDFCHRESLAEHDFIADRGDTPETPLEQLENDYDAQRQMILTQLRHAESRTVELAEQCDKAGLSIVDLRRNHSSGALSSICNAEECPHPPVPPGICQEKSGQPETSDGSPLPIQKRSRIEHWLGSVSDHEEPAELLESANAWS